MKYPKINTLWKRDARTHKVIIGDLSLPEFDVPKSWMVSEKVDGTNVRVVLDYRIGSQQEVTFAGRTEDGMLHPFLLKWLQKTFTETLMREVFKDVRKECGSAILFGEGYGTKVNGKKYGVEAEFVLFDVVVENVHKERSVIWWWLERKNVREIAQKIGINSVMEMPMTMKEVEVMFRLHGVKSVLAANNGSDIEMEGVVVRTEPLLLRRDGTPLMWKLKRKDFL